MPTPKLLKILASFVAVAALTRAVIFYILTSNQKSRSLDTNDAHDFHSSYSRETRLSIVNNHGQQWQLDISKINTTFLMDRCRVANTSICLKYFEPRPVNPFIFNFKNVGGGSCPGDTEIVILIPSLHSKVDERVAHRNTWISGVRSNRWPWGADDNGVTQYITLNATILIRFVFGTHSDPNLEKAISEESDTYGDIIQGDFEESYVNLTLKSLLMLKWMSTYCPNAKYMVKLDDDVFLNAPVLVNVLHRQLVMNWTVLGHHQFYADVLTEGKWAVPPEAYPFDKYPPYAEGPIYALTRDVIQPLFISSEFMRWLPNGVEDVYVTGVLGYIININRAHNDNLKRYITTSERFCRFRTSHPVYVFVGIDSIYALWDILENEKQASCLPR